MFTTLPAAVTASAVPSRTPRTERGIYALPAAAYNTSSAGKEPGQPAVGAMRLRERPLERVVVWLRELRLPFLGASLVGVALGSAQAYYYTGAFTLWPFVLALVATALVHSGANVCNDYFDHISGTDHLNVSFIRPFTGGSRLIQQGLLPPASVLRGGIVLTGLGAAAGALLAACKNLAIVPVGVVGILAGILYSSPPARVASRGLGELVIAGTFGVLVPIGGWLAQTRALGLSVLPGCLPLAMLIAAVIIINEVPDLEADSAVGKKTLVVRLGRAWALRLHVVLLSGAMIAVALFVLAGLMPRQAALALLCVPAVASAIRTTLTGRCLLAACALTAVTHALTGLLLSIGFVAARAL